MSQAIKAAVEISPGFLKAEHGYRHVIEYLPTSGSTKEFVIMAPPFAEEMNRARRTLHLLGKRLAEIGIGSILIDLFGTGDSSGNFAQANWNCWLEDLALARAWATSRGRIKAVLGLRFGALLAAALQRKNPADKLILWQPMMQGREQLTDFLRLRRLADQFSGHGPVRSRHDLEAALLRGESIHAAGYELSGSLAGSIFGIELTSLLEGISGPVHVLTVGSKTQATQPAAHPLAKLAAQESHIDFKTMPGPRFWNTLETITAPALLDETERVLRA